MRAMTTAILSAAGVLALTTGAMAQVTSNSRVYHLRAGSSEELGCFGACLCPVLLEQPLRGRFVLTHTSDDGLFNHYAISNVRWFAPVSGHRYTGSGTYAIGGEVAVLQQMAVSLTNNSGVTQQFDSGVEAVSATFPVIQTRLEIPNSACWHVELAIRATPLMGDWNGDGSLTLSDMFGFIGSWFSGDGDVNDDDQQNVTDLFDFVGAWFAGT